MGAEKSKIRLKENNDGEFRPHGTKQELSSVEGEQEKVERESEDRRRKERERELRRE